MEGKTSIVIAHRLSTVERADIIYVINSGQIVERGVHKRLLEAGGLYSDLYQLQIGSHATASPASQARA